MLRIPIARSRPVLAGCKGARASSSHLAWALRLRSSMLNPALTETVMPTATVDTNVSCAVTIAPLNDHQVPFYLTSATGGLQEALNQNLTTPQTNTVILDSAFYELVGGPANAAAVIAAAQGSSKLGLMDVTQVPTVWYQWNGTQYVKVAIIGRRRQPEHTAR